MSGPELDKARCADVGEAVDQRLYRVTGSRSQMLMDAAPMVARRCVLA
jgi:hypothetical protein